MSTYESNLVIEAALHLLPGLVAKLPVSDRGEFLAGFEKTAVANSFLLAAEFVAHAKRINPGYGGAIDITTGSTKSSVNAWEGATPFTISTGTEGEATERREEFKSAKGFYDRCKGSLPHLPIPIRETTRHYVFDVHEDARGLAYLKMYAEIALEAAKKRSDPESVRTVNQTKALLAGLEELDLPEVEAKAAA